MSLSSRAQGAERPRESAHAAHAHTHMRDAARLPHGYPNLGVSQCRETWHLASQDSRWGNAPSFSELGEPDSLKQNHATLHAKPAAHAQERLPSLGKAYGQVYS